MAATREDTYVRDISALTIADAEEAGLVTDAPDDIDWSDEIRILLEERASLSPDALTGMPVLIGANAGTARHSLAIDYAIRPLFAYLHAEPVSTGVFAASSDWGAAADDVAPLSARVDRGAREFAAAIARRPAAQNADPLSPENYLDSFTRLLNAPKDGHLLGGLAGE